MNKPEILNMRDALQSNIIGCSTPKCNPQKGFCVYCRYEREILDIIQYVNQLEALNKSLKSEKQSLTNTNSVYQNQITKLEKYKERFHDLEDKVKEAVDILETESDI